MYTYQIENLHTFKDNHALFRANWEETGIVPGMEELAISFDTFSDYVAKDCFTIVSVRHENIVVGYALLIISQHRHSVHTKVCSVDTIFIAKNHRKGFVGIKLIKYAELCAKLKGATLFLQRVKTERDFSPLLLRTGYRKTETVYTKEL